MPEALSPLLEIDLADERATVALAEDIAAVLASGDVVALKGDLGAGKTTFARAVLRALADDPTLEVPSPTFTLVQTYAAGRLSVSHYDLFRIGDPGELDEIGFEDAADGGAVLVEWPERAGDRIPPDALTVSLAVAGAGRRAVLTGGGTWPDRVARTRRIRGFLDGSGWPGATRRHLAGDASHRRYERLHRHMRTAVLMDWPATGMLPAGDPRAPFRARNIEAFQAVDEALRGLGLSAPEIFAADREAGLLLMEDLGNEGIAPGQVPDPERYLAAIEVLAEIHSAPRPAQLGAHALPMLAGPALAPEVGLFAASYVPFARAMPLSEAEQEALDAIWSKLFARLAETEKSWILFDMQSPNLFWLPDRQGPARVGLIDFQDAFFGPSAYDVASLCQDARVTVPADLEAHLSARYVDLRRAADPAFDVAAFSDAYAISAAIRTCKNLGVFARLAAAGQPAYLQHVERLRAYLRRTLASPFLSPLRLWYEKAFPA